MTRQQILALAGGIGDLHDQRLMYVGIFCGPRASEVLGCSGSLDGEWRAS